VFLCSVLARSVRFRCSLVRATYLGGSGGESGRALAIQLNSGEVFAAGLTSSTNFPGTAGGAQPPFGGGLSDAFLVRFTADLAQTTPTPTPTVTPTPTSPPGPGIPSDIPTLSPWMLALLAAALVSIGLLLMRRNL